MRVATAACLIFVLLTAPGIVPAAAARYDVVLRGGTVVDGTGAPRRKADVAFRGERIVAVGKVAGDSAVTIDVSGMLITPGFIDMHNHSDQSRLLDPHGPSYSLQGVTTEVWGEDFSMAPLGGKQDPHETWMPAGLKPTWRTFGEFLRAVESKGSAANFCSFVGSGGIRAYVVGYENRPATSAEIEEEKRLVREAMREGAMGVSSGLSYVPNVYMSTDELTALVAEAGRAGGIHATHARTINGQDPQAIHEVVAIAEKTGAALHLFHLNSIASWSAPDFLPIIAAARLRGVAVTADAYPYTWGITGLADYLPSSALEGGRETMLGRLRDPEQRARIARGFTTEPPFYATIGWNNVRLGVRDPRVNAKLVSEVAAERGISAEDAYMDVVLEQRGHGLIIDLNNREDTLRMVMQQPYVAVGTDGNAVSLEADPPAVPLLHPRNIATFPRWLGHYVRREQLMSWEEAIRRMTSLPASILRLQQRGTLAVGQFADIVVFDPATITDRATFADPAHYSLGVRHVFVNGQPVVRDGAPTQRLPGRALRGPGYRADASRRSSLSAAERKIVTATQSENAAAVQLLQTLVNINSGTLNLEGVERVGQIMREELQQLGFEARWISMSEVGRAGHVVARHRGSGRGTRMLLLGHLDTVFEKDSEFQKFVRRGDVAEGPGVNDMKGGLAIMIAALRAMKNAGALRQADITVVLTGDEERPGRPLSIARRDMLEAAKHSDVALEFESLVQHDGRDMGTVARRSGSTWTVRVTATSGHSSRVFSDELGFGAAYELARILDAFRLDVREPNATFNVGLFGGGTLAKVEGSTAALSGKANIIPAQASAVGDLRTLSNDQTERLRAKMREIVARSLPGTRAEIRFEEGYPAMSPTEGNRGLLRSLNEVNRRAGLQEMGELDPLERGAGDVAFVADRLAALSGLGAAGRGAHAPGETIDLSSLDRQIQRAALFMTALANQRFPAQGQPR